MSFLKAIVVFIKDYHFQNQPGAKAAFYVTTGKFPVDIGWGPFRLIGKFK